MKAMKVKVVKEIKGRLFVAECDGGYHRIFFEDKKGKKFCLDSYNGSGAYSDTFLSKIEGE